MRPGSSTSTGCLSSRRVSAQNFNASPPGKRLRSSSAESEGAHKCARSNRPCLFGGTQSAPISDPRLLNYASTNPRSYTLCVAMLTGVIHWFTATLPLDVAQFKQVLEPYVGAEPHVQRLIWRGRNLDDRVYDTGYFRNPADRSIIQLEFSKRMVGGKPVIYLFPPSQLDTVAVSLDLVPEWTFSALYPLVPINSSKLIKGGTNVNWTVSASPTGQLVEKESSLALSYLFWEGHAPQLALNTRLLSPPSSPTLDAPSFNPGLASLSPHNSIALPLPLLLPYLDTVLASLTLHTSARNDFITSWLASFARLQARGQHIAIRFLPQVEYEQAAVLEVEPQPSVVTRVFMLFRGVDGETASKYKKAGDVGWREVVGVKREATDEKLFRVLEWGGMEVPMA